MKYVLCVYEHVCAGVGHVKKTDDGVCAGGVGRVSRAFSTCPLRVMEFSIHDHSVQPHVGPEINKYYFSGSTFFKMWNVDFKLHKNS